MKRDAIATLIRARVAPLVDDLVDRVVDRVVLQLDQALDAARSALESDLAIGDRDLKPDNISSDDGSSRPAEVVDSATNTPPQLTPVAPPSSRSRAPSSDLSSPRRQKTCSKCGAVGFSKAGCGRTHNVPLAPAKGDYATSEPPAVRAASSPAPTELDDDDTDDESEKTESPPQVARKRDRFAAIEERAAIRRGELPVPRTTFEI